MECGGRPALNGLKQYAKKICKLLEEKGTAPQDELANILAEEVLANWRREAEFKAEMRMMEEEDDTLSELEEDGSCPQKKLKTMQTNAEKKKLEPEKKSIYRRVYDAINVLEALGIVEKGSKGVTWRGKLVRPIGVHQVSKLERYQAMCRRHDEGVKSVCEKRQHLQGKLEDIITNHNLYRLNNMKQQKAHKLYVPLKEKTNEIRSYGMNEEDRVPLPFIVAGASNRAIIKCNISKECTDVMFESSLPFEVVKDRDILMRMSTGRTTTEDLSNILPAKLLKFSLKNKLLDHLIDRQNPCRLASHFSPTATQAPAVIIQVPTLLPTGFAPKLQPKIQPQPQVQLWRPPNSAKNRKQSQDSTTPHEVRGGVTGSGKVCALPGATIKPTAFVSLASLSPLPWWHTDCTAGGGVANTPAALVGLAPTPMLISPSVRPGISVLIEGGRGGDTRPPVSCH